MGELAHVISYQGDSDQIHLKYFLILAMVTIVQKNEKQEMLVDTEKSEPGAATKTLFRQQLPRSK